MGEWYSYDPDCGYEEHDTEAEARAAAEQALEYRRDVAGEGWAEDTDQIVWGRVMGRAMPTTTHTHGPDCRTEDGCPEGHSLEFDYIARFDLTETGCEDPVRGPR